MICKHCGKTNGTNNDCDWCSRSYYDYHCDLEVEELEDWSDDDD